jgi:hypothetical protein
MKKILFNSVIIATLLVFGLNNMVHSQAVSKKKTIYRRSSICTLMLDNVRMLNDLKVNSKNSELITESFIKSSVPDKFNNHNLSIRTIPVEASKGKRSKNALRQVDLELTDVNNFFEANHVARDLVAKWFNRSETGGFDTRMLTERGNYNATASDIEIAEMSKRGLAILGDAGEELIKNTFVIVNTFEYLDKNKADVTTKMITGSGFFVFIKTYLFQLDWNEETERTFYNDYWCDNKTVTHLKRQAFDESKLFQLKYLGFSFTTLTSRASYRTKDTQETLIDRATVKAIDEIVVKLQKKYDDFKTKAPLYSSEPITAMIGLKEGLSEKSMFDVLEQEVDDKGRTKYKVVGAIKVDDSHPIWDNRYGAREENPDTTTDRTYFKKVSGNDFYPGMLIVQKKGK